MRIGGIMRKGIAGMAWAGLCLATPVLADVKAGVEAWEHGDYPAAVREWQLAAQQGNADALFNLGQAYAQGRGVPLDLAQAEAMFAKAAQKGHQRASNAYGLLLFQRGQHTAAMPYIRSGADSGDLPSLYLLGLAYFNAQDVSKDWIRAYALERLAAWPASGAPGMPQAKQALEQMDRYIPTEDRQKGIAMADDMAAQMATNRNRLATAADLGTRAAPAAAPAPAAMPTQATAPRPSRPATALAQPPAPPRPATAKPQDHSAPPSTSGAWKLQLGAYSVAAHAEAQWNKVKAMPVIAGHPRQTIASGKLTRLLATGYSEEAAHAACRRLTGAGLDCIAVHD